MTGTPLHADIPPTREVAARLCVVLACHEVVCALPIDNIDRLVLPDAVEMIAAPRVATAGLAEVAGAATVPVPDVVRVADKCFAAWDLGILFGMAPVSGAWVLISLMHAGAELRLALRTGPCFAVQSLRNLLKIPSEVFQHRRGALVEAFPTAELKKGNIGAKVGVLVDPMGLWTRKELAISAAVLDAAEGRSHGRP